MKPLTLRPTNTPGASRIQTSATCLTITPIVRLVISGGPNEFHVSPKAITVRMQPAIQAWTNATVNQSQPDPGNDGIFFVGYKVTDLGGGMWHYQYAVFNMNLDRAIQSFSVPLGPGVNVTNIDFHAPPQHPGWAHDGTQGDAGYSSTPWDVDTTDPNFITWSTETFATNQNANAIRWGTLYNFRFDADQAPNPTSATVGFFKTGSPAGVVVQAPGGVPARRLHPLLQLPRRLLLVLHRLRLPQQQRLPLLSNT